MKLRNGWRKLRDNMENVQARAIRIFRIMGRELGLRCANAQIEHWNDPELERARTCSKWFWQNVYYEIQQMKEWWEA